MRRIVLVLTFMMGAMLLATGLAVAASQLDQRNSDESTYEGNGVAIFGSGNTFQTAAQIFTAGQTGDLDKVRVWLQPGPFHPDDGIRASIQPLDNAGHPQGIANALGRGQIGPVLPGNAWVDITLSQPASVTAGTKYALVMDTTRGEVPPGEPAPPPETFYRWNISNVDAYPRGIAQVSSGGGLWQGNTNQDFFFETYVNTDGQPPNNQPPEVFNDSYSTDEDNALTVAAPGVLGNDTDAEGNSLTVTNNTSPAHGSVTVNAGGSFTYTPDGNFHGSDSFDYTVSDGNGGTDTGKVNLTVNAVNDAPEVTPPPPFHTNEDTPLQVALSASDVDGDSLTFGIVSSPANGELSQIGPVTCQGTVCFANVTYTPDEDYNGFDIFSFEASDGTEDSNPAPMHIFVAPVNDDPVNSVPGNQSTNEDTALTFNSANSNLISTSDVDAGSNAVKVTLQVTHGKLTLSGTSGLNFTAGSNGTANMTFTGTIADINSALSGLTFDPDANYNGPADLTITTDDQGNIGPGGAKTDSDTVNISVNAVNDAPVVTFTDPTGDTQTLDEDKTTTRLYAYTVTDIDNANPTVDESCGSGGSLKPDETGDPQNSFRCLFADDAITKVSATANDGESTNNTGNDSIDVTVNNVPPTAVDDNPAAVAEGTNVTLNVLNNDTDPGDDTLTVTNNTDGQHGTVNCDQDGSCTYTPSDPDFFGTDTFTYTVSDGDGGTDEGTVNVEITAVNDEPTFDVPANAPAVNEDSGAQTVGGFATNISAGAANESSQQLNFEVTHNTNSALFSAQPSIDPATGDLTYTPDADANGAAEITVVLKDDGGTANGGNDTSAEQTFTITVGAVNDEPSFTAGANQTVNEDSGAHSVAWATDISAGPGESGQPLNFEVTNDNNSLFSNQPQVSANDGTLSYTPADNANGMATVSVTLHDDGGNANGGDDTSDTKTFTIDVTAVNDAPVANDDTAQTDEDIPLVINDANTLATNDNKGAANENDQNLGVTEVSAGPNTHGTVDLQNGKITYTPEANYNGPASFDYKVCDDGTTNSQPDSKCDTGTVNVTVTPVNDAPETNDDTATTDEDVALEILASDLLANDDDVDGDPLSISSFDAQTAQGGTVSRDNDTFTYTPAEDFFGSDSFSYTVSDSNGGIDTATVNINVTAVNDAPVAASDEETTPEDTPVAIDVLANDNEGAANESAQTLYVKGIVTEPANGTAQVVTEDGPDKGWILYTPNPNYSGSDTFTYEVCDNGDPEECTTENATVNVNISAVNDAPVAADDSATTPEDNAVTIDVLTNDTDVDGDSLSIVAGSLSDPDHGTATVDNGKINYTPDDDFHGSDSFTYEVSDGNGGTDTANVSINVIAVNDDPVALADSYQTNEDVPLTINAQNGVLSNDTDVDGDPLEAVLISGPSNGTLTLSADGSFTYTPNPNFNGEDTFTYRAVDPGDAQASATVTVTIEAVNDAPVANDDTLTTDEDTAGNGNVLTNDTDADNPNSSNDGLTVQDADTSQAGVQPVSGPAHGQLTLNADGSYTYTPNGNFNGSDEFTYKVNDGTVDSNVATVSITVKAVNDAPVAEGDSYDTNQNTALNVAVPGVLANDNDPDGDSFTAELVSGPSHGQLTLNANGSFTYTPNANYNGPDSFTYRANDGKTAGNTATVSITVNAVNDAPTVVSVNPSDPQTPVSTTTDITVTFSKKMDVSTLNDNTVKLVKPGKKPTSIPWTKNTDDSTGRTVLTLNPFGLAKQNLAANTTYQLTIEGAGDGDNFAVKDLAGNELADDVVSSFTTARK